MKVKSESEVAQSCPTLSDPMDRSLPGSSVHGIFQARVLEWRAIAFSKLNGLKVTDPDLVINMFGYTEWLMYTRAHLENYYKFEGNVNPLHCSCLENPRDGGAWWAAIYGVTQSQT